MYRQIQQLVVPGVKALFGQHIAAYLFGARERAGILEAHDLEQIGVLIAVFLAADDAARKEFQMRDKAVVFDGRAVRRSAACIR